MHQRTLRTPVLMKVLKIELPKSLGLIKVLKRKIIAPEKSGLHQRFERKSYCRCKNLQKKNNQKILKTIFQHCFLKNFCWKILTVLFLLQREKRNWSRGSTVISILFLDKIYNFPHMFLTMNLIFMHLLAPLIVLNYLFCTGILSGLSVS